MCTPHSIHFSELSSLKPTFGFPKRKEQHQRECSLGKHTHSINMISTTVCARMQPTPTNIDTSNHITETSFTVPPFSPEPDTEPRRRGSSYADGRGSLSLYLQEIGKVRLLTAEEEIELAQRIRAGDKEARELMIKANLRLVVKFARDYEGLGVPLMDLISEGNIGLIKAVEYYDPTKGARFSTYGSW